jgi:hypothetical protein
MAAMASDSASQSTVMAPVSSRQNFDLARKAARVWRGWGRFGPAAPFGAGLVMGSVISTSQLALPRRELGLPLPEKVVKLGQKHGYLRENHLPKIGINRLISKEKGRALS